MKKQITLLCFFLVAIFGYGQYYYLPSSSNGNPGGLNTDGEFPMGSGLDGAWVSIQGTSASPTWSASQTIPFTFNFNGSPVTSYVASSTGVVTFTASPGTAPAASAVALPDANIPDNSICVLGLQASGSNDNVVTKTFGTAGSQQHWIFFTSFSNPADASCWHYWAIVLEEGTDDIYIVDMRNSCSVDLSLGIQINSTEAYSVSGSPAVANQSGTNSSDADNAYYHFIQGVQPTEDMAGVEMTGAPYNILANAPFDITGRLINLGSATVTSMDINYSIDGGTPVTQNLSGLNIASLGSYDFTHGTPWNPGATGAYTVEVWASNINGNPDQNTSNDKVSGVMNVVDAFSQRIPLYETFTSSTCGPCVPGNVNLEGLFASNPGKYSSIKYQMSWPGNGDPYFTDEGNDRRNYYAINSVPRLEIDGGWDGNASSVTQSIMDDAYAIPSFIDISATYSVSGQTIDVDVAIDPVSDINNNNLVVHIGVIEYLTTQNTGSNGETEFHHVMKKMLPDANGSSISALTSGNIVNVNQSYTFNGSYRLPNNANDPINHTTEHSVEEFSDLGVIVWVQDVATKEVLQSTSAMNHTGIGENNNLVSAKIYPNPVNGIATLAFHLADNAKDLTVEIYDNMGRLVSSNNYGGFNAGRSILTIDTDGFSNGVYFVNLVSGTDRLVKKMNVMK